ncbi:TOBE domain-containing protein [bacterium]|jgi:ABC-type Fe3+/spermidine/putrescine transport system ATPase subunit|nr:TOBE domain-containing protein [bacterium]
MINFDSIEEHIKDGSFTFLIGPQSSDRTDFLLKIRDKINFVQQKASNSDNHKLGFKRFFFDRSTNNDSSTVDKDKSNTKPFLTHLKKSDSLMLFDKKFKEQYLSVQKYLSSSLGISFSSEKKVSIEYWLKWSGLCEKRSHKISELKPEQQIILKLASLLIKSPRLVLIDTVFDSLNFEPRNTILSLLKKTAKKHKISFVLSTNSLPDAYTHATTIAVIIDNKIKQIADPQSIYYEPKTSDVALFTGEGCLYPVTVLNRNAIQIENEIHETNLHADLVGEKKLNLFIRANQLFLNPASDFEITITDVKFMGSMSMYTAKTNSGHRLLIADYTAIEYKIGEKVGISFQFNAFPLFKIKESVTTQYAQIPA